MLHRLETRAGEVCAAGLLTVALAAVQLWRPAPVRVSSRAGFDALWTRSANSMEAFRRGVRAEPSSPFRWADLAEALAETGDNAGARAAFAQAGRLGPRLPQIALRLLWFHLGDGRIAPAMAAARRVLNSGSEWDAPVYQAFTRYAVGDSPVLDQAIAGDARAARSWLRFVVELGDDARAAAAWRHMAARRLWDRAAAVLYSRRLFAHQDPVAAFAIWREAMRGVEPDLGTRTWVFNGGFERDWGGGPLDWEVAVSGVFTASPDSSRRAAGGRSLRVRFHGAERLDLRGIGQRTVLPPGRYRLYAMLASDALAFEGVGLRVVDAGPDRRILARTPAVSGTRDWTVATADLVLAGAQPAAVRVELMREPPRDPLARMEGTLWVDDVRLEKL